MQICDENKLFVASLAITLSFPTQNLIWPSFGEIKNKYKMTNKRKKYSLSSLFSNREFGQ